MADLTYHRVASVSEIEEGKMACVTVGERRLLLCRLPEGFFVVDDNCSHADARLSEGRLRGHRIMCPIHGAAFDVRDGKVLGKPAVRPIASFPVRVTGEDVEVGIPD